MLIPETPQLAYRHIKLLADKKGVTVSALLKRIDMETSRGTVFRWLKNTRTFDITLFKTIVQKAMKIKS